MTTLQKIGLVLHPYLFVNSNSGPDYHKWPVYLTSGLTIIELPMHLTIKAKLASQVPWRQTQLDTWQGEKGKVPTMVEFHALLLHFFF